MRIKRYIVNNMPEAIKVIKQDLGTDAVIIESKMVREKGILGFFKPKKMEVTAAIGRRNTEFNPQSVSGAQIYKQIKEKFAEESFIPKQAEENFHHKPQLHLVENMGQKSAAASFGMMLDNAKKQKGVMSASAVQTPESTGSLVPTDSIISQEKPSSATGNDLKGRSAAFNRYKRLLLDLEIDEALVETLLDKIDFEPNHPDAGDLFKLSLRNKIIKLVEPFYDDENNEQQVIVFVGPTGVGKTTTLAKIAGHLRLNEHKKLGLITIDTYRIGAVEQFKKYGDILGIPVDVVHNPTELQKKLKKHGDKDMVIIDTAGRSSKNTSQVLELNSFLEVVKRPMNVYLVLSATTKKRDLARIIEDFKKVQYNKLIFTKTDETDTLGSILNLIYTVKLPASYVTTGQRVPEDIEQMYPKKLAEMIIAGVDWA